MPGKKKGQKKGAQAQTEAEAEIDSTETEEELEDSKNSINKSYDDDENSNAYSRTTESCESDQSTLPGSPRQTRKTFSLFNEDVTDNINLRSKQAKEVKSPTKLIKETVSFSENDVSLSESKIDMKSLCLVGCVVIAIIAIVLSLSNEEKPSSIPLSDRFKEFGNDVDDLKNVFLNQDKRFWRTVKASGRHVLNVTEPEYPAVLLFITNMNLDPQNKMDVSSCLARKISQGFNVANEKTGPSPVIDCDQLDQSSQDGGKWQFDKNLRNYLDGNYKAVVIDNLEHLSPQAALLLHGICDGDNAPYKDVMIILVLHTDQRNLDGRSGEDFLRNMWERELDSDKVGALMSRVANNAVIVNSELKTLESTCR
ncbi:hypothetical protein SNE40_000053 [Patella caerulea]|uniref:Torsin-1A-interacting protein 1/2 AAA+ activator domain-containing protein n=1 Tax=Patella caerulea TaxID=87958 RepID=A0AAN8KIQ4_PATCE